MATVKEILAVETAQKENKGKIAINLFLEGSFLRAYELSAWLCMK